MLIKIKVKFVEIYKSDKAEFGEIVEIGSLMCLLKVRISWHKHLEGNLSASNKDQKCACMILQQSHLPYNRVLWRNSHMRAMFVAVEFISEILLIAK